MNRKWLIIMGLVLSLITVIIVAVPVLAQNEEPAATANTNRGALAIIAPWTVPAGREFTVRAFLRENQEPFPGAGVWAIGADSTDALKAELGQFKEESSQPDVTTDYESILGRHGGYLGRTGGDGYLTCTIEQPGKYVLVAARNGYQPGFTHIGIRDTVNALAIRAPKRAPAGEPVTIVVFERITQSPVEDAVVFAVTRDNADTLKKAAQALKEDTSIAAEDKDYEALCNTYGFFLGRTDENGKLEFTIDEAGVYLLVAVKRGYFPGFSLMAIVNKPKALGIKSVPPRTHVGKEVTLNVFDRQTSDPVEGAGIWAMSRDEAAALKQEIAATGEDANTAAAERDYEAVVSAHGTFLGFTDGNGKLPATFDTAGIYVLVTAKPGYLPGFTVLPVKEMPEPSTVEKESRANVPSLKTNSMEIR